MAENDSEKKHAPTEKRLREAREKGQIRRSNDLPKAATTLATILAAVGLSGLLAGATGAWLAGAIRNAGHLNIPVAVDNLNDFLFVLACFLMVIAGIALVAGFASGGWMLSLALVAPKLERLNPGSSWGQIFSLSNAIEILKSIVKIVVIGGFAWMTYAFEQRRFVSLSGSRHLSLLDLGSPAFIVIAGATVGACALAAVDVGVQAWLNRRNLKLTDQELRDEIKNMDGDPQVRARRRALMRKLARARMQQAVRTASVVITNPSHYAVAIRYRRGLDPVPIVVAKGSDFSAVPLIDAARQYGVPRVEAPPLARALHRVVEIDRPIPGHLYRAVAEVLAYIWRLEAWKMSGGTRPVAPQFPDQLDSPSEDAA